MAMIIRSLALLGQLSSGSLERTKFEKRYLHKNGSTIWVIIAATMLYGNQGQPLYYVSQIEDITKRKEIENDLILSEKNTGRSLKMSRTYAIRPTRTV